MSGKGRLERCQKLIPNVRYLTMPIAENIITQNCALLSVRIKPAIENIKRSENLTERKADILDHFQPHLEHYLL